MSKSETYGIISTVFIHLLLFICLIFFGFDKPESTPAEEGLTVNFGNIDDAAGLFEPAGESTTDAESVPVAEPAPTPRPDEEIITQHHEPSVSLADQKKKEAKQAILKEQKIQTEQNLKAAAIRSQAASAFGTSTGKAKSQGTGSIGTGNQGVPNGDPISTNTKGGGTGYGNFSLNGRTSNGGLPHLSYTIQEEGVVVVQITVSPKGKVITASISLQGTNTDNSTLRNAALSAAKQARFNTISSSQNQSGTITYRFRLK